MNSRTPDVRFFGTTLSRSGAILVACGIPMLIAIVDGFFKEPLYRTSSAAFWVFDIFKFVLVTVVVLVWLARAFSITPVSYGLRPDRRSESWFHIFGLVLFLAVILNLVYMVANYFAWAIVWRVFHPEPVVPFYGSIVPNGLLHYPVALYFGATAGFSEEIFFRGLPLLYIKEKFPSPKANWVYVVGTSLLFAMAHWENGLHEIAATFAFGVAASALYLKLRDLWPLVGAHALIDFWLFS